MPELFARIRHARLLALAGIAAFLFSQPGCEKLKGFLPKPRTAAAKPATPPPAPTAEEEPKSAATEESAALFGPEKKKEKAAEDPNAPKEEPFELNKSALVSILLYHDFVDRILRNEMTVSLPVFRAQMQALKDENIPVISMSDLLAWKKGEKNIPDECVVITLDDGWLAQHQLAFPILKEFGYPFTIYLYKKYVNIGGRSMTIAQIKELLANGGELGSHSISHQPLAMKKGRTDEVYKAWLQEEIVDSKKWLEETFGIPCRTFAYPYGNKSEEVVEMTMAAGYEAAVTTNPQKVSWETPNGKLGRFTQQWDKDTNFKAALSFHGRIDSGATTIAKVDAVDESGKKLFELSPTPNTEINDRRPVIRANLAGVGGVIPDSLMLRVSGFGAVPVSFDASTQTASYQVQQKLRSDDCTVVLGFRRVGGDKEEMLTWKFKVDQKALYSARDTPPPGPLAPGEKPLTAPPLAAPPSPTPTAAAPAKAHTEATAPKKSKKKSKAH